MNPQDIQLITLCAGTVIPAIVGLVTSTKASVPFQTAISAFLSVVVGIVSAWSYAGGSFDWITLAVASGSTFITTIVFARAVYRKPGIEKIQKVTDGIALDRVIGPSVQSKP